MLRRAKQTLEKHLPLEAAGYVCSSQTLYEVLLGVAVNRSTIEAVCADLIGAPNPQTIRNYLNRQLREEELPKLERRLNAALAAHWPKKLRRGSPVQVAIDFHDRPFYGKTPQDEGLWMRGEAKLGTTRFYRVATAYLIQAGQRVTLAIRLVLPEDRTVEVLGDLWRGMRQRGLRLGSLYLDKGFASIEVFEYLRRRQQAALIACPIRGKRGGTRALCTGPESYSTIHWFTSVDKQKYPERVAVCRVFTTRKRSKRGKRRGEWLLFVQINLNWTPRQCRRRYRKRFGIETSYRIANKMRGWTTSPNPAYRFVLIGLGFILLNLWVHLCWLYTQVARRGRRHLRRQLFRQSRFIKFLTRALERLYGGVLEITAPAVPLL